MFLHITDCENQDRRTDQRSDKEHNPCQVIDPEKHQFRLSLMRGQEIDRERQGKLDHPEKSDPEISDFECDSEDDRNDYKFQPAADPASLNRSGQAPDFTGG
mgnify:CR=1 FL=1